MLTSIDVELSSSFACSSANSRYVTIIQVAVSSGYLPSRILATKTPFLYVQD